MDDGSVLSSVESVQEDEYQPSLLTKDFIKRLTAQSQEYFDDRDYSVILSKRDDRKSSLAVIDILNSKRIPFKVEDEIIGRNDSVGNSSNNARGNRRMMILPALNNEMTEKHKKEIQNKVQQKQRKTITEIMREKEAQEELEKLANRTVDAKLQYCLELMNQSKTDVNPSKLMYEAAEVFYTLQMYDRSAYCYIQATKRNDVDRIVDTIYLPNDEKYQRKLERMSPIMLPIFLSDRSKKREELIKIEYEKQRIRCKLSNLQLFRIYLLIEDVRDIWLAHEFLIKAFTLVYGDIEFHEMLVTCHQYILEYSKLTKNRSDFMAEQQLVRGSAGPISDDHLHILLQLEIMEPKNEEYQEWLGMRYAEKCEFEESRYHFKKLRDLRDKRPPEKRSSLELFRREGGPVHQQTQELLQTISRNSKKQMSAIYTNYAPNVHIPVNTEKNRKLKLIPISEQAIDTLPQRPLIKEDISSSQTTQTNDHEKTIATVNDAIQKRLGKRGVTMIASKNNTDQTDTCQSVSANTATKIKDLAWFGGCHEDATTIVYFPPPQGWL